jgi:hypothetical protein
MKMCRLLQHALLVLCIGNVQSAPAAVQARYRVVAYLPHNQPGGIVEGSPGVFYTEVEGAAILSVTARGTVTVLASIKDPPYILSSSPGAIAVNGLLYSSLQVVEGLGSGNIFSVGPAAGSEQIYPPQRLTALPVAGNLPNGEMFGVAYDFSNGSNSIATIDIQGHVAPFYTFLTTDRIYVPIYGADGNFYGTAQPTNGDYPYLYQVTPSGSFTQVATLPFLIAAFAGAGTVLQGTDGNFYGIQSTGLGCGGGNQHGGVYKLTPTGQYTLLHDFGVCGVGVVDTLIQASDGNLYGTDEGNSVLFRITTSGEYSVAKALPFGGCPCRLLQGADGLFYGTATDIQPLVFAVNAGLSKPAPASQNFMPKSGSVSSTILLWGRNLLGATVQFNGTVSASVSNRGPNYVYATVPAGATTGPITVTTPGGTSTTHASFTVE